MERRRGNQHAPHRAAAHPASRGRRRGGNSAVPRALPLDGPAQRGAPSQHRAVRGHLGLHALAQQVDSEELLEIVDPLVRALSDIVARYEGYEEKYAGDAIGHSAWCIRAPRQPRRSRSSCHGRAGQPSGRSRGQPMESRWLRLSAGPSSSHRARGCGARHSAQEPPRDPRRCRRGSDLRRSSRPSSPRHPATPRDWHIRASAAAQPRPMNERTRSGVMTKISRGPGRG